MLSKFPKTIDAETIMTQIVGYLPNVFMAVVLALLFWLANRIIQKVLFTTLNRMNIEKQAVGLLLRTARVALFVFAFLTVADQLQINIKSLLAGVGVVGLAISFAAKDTVGNIISGIVIIIDRPFKQGDWISIGTMHATVTDIRLRTTVLTTFDNETVVVPNQQLSQERIVNYTMTPNIRVKVPVGIAYKEDIDQARKVMLQTLEGDDRILSDPPPVVWVISLGDSSVNLQLRFWIRNASEQFIFVFEYTEKCKKALDKAGIEIPYPHLQLFLEQTKAIEKLADNK